MHGIKVTFLTNFLTGKPLRDSFLLFTSDIFPESYRREKNCASAKTEGGYTDRSAVSACGAFRKTRE
jgi:hypothetical protein